MDYKFSENSVDDCREQNVKEYFTLPTRDGSDSECTDFTVDPSLGHDID